MDASYSQQYQSLWREHWWWQSRHQLVLRKLGQVLPCRRGDRATLLDIGCGGGVGFDDFNQFGDIYGLEPDPHLAGSLPRWRSRIEPVPFDTNYRSPRRYDLVLMLDVLEHLEDDAGAAAALRQLLKPGGQLLLTVPALPSLWSRHDEVNHHYRRYRAGKLRRLLGKAGLDVTEVRYLYFWSLIPLYLARRLLPGSAHATTLRVPAKPINAVCRWLSVGESALRVPIGSSLMAVARRAA